MIWDRFFYSSIDITFTLCINQFLLLNTFLFFFSLFYWSTWFLYFWPIWALCSLEISVSPSILFLIFYFFVLSWMLWKLITVDKLRQRLVTQMVMFLLNVRNNIGPLFSASTFSQKHMPYNVLTHETFVTCFSRTLSEDTDHTRLQQQLINYRKKLPLVRPKILKRKRKKKIGNCKAFCKIHQHVLTKNYSNAIFFLGKTICRSLFIAKLLLFIAIC